MSLLRRGHLPLTFALLAALAVLFVSTVSMACEAPAEPGVAAMPMTDHSGPCEPKAVKTACQKACLVFCQSLLPQGAGSTPTRLYAQVRYPSLDARHADFAPEADDPPPRS